MSLNQFSSSTFFICRNCKREFIPNKYHPNAKFCSRECCVSYLNKNKPKNYQLLQRHRVKREIFVLLGGKCVSCGYSGIALQVDHINNNGKEDISNHRSSSLMYWKYVLEQVKKGSKDYQLMCPTCNMEKELRRKGYGN